MRVVERRYCDRSHNQHEIARAEVTDQGERQVVVRAMVPGSKGFTIHAFTYTAEVLEGCTVLSVTAACACGRTFTLDIAAPLEGRKWGKPLRLKPRPGDYGDGKVPPDIDRG